MNRIGIITRDCGGVNAAVRAVVRTASSLGRETIGILKGFDGLIRGELLPLNRRSVSGIINLGGTILKTSRSTAFHSIEGQEKALKTLKENGIDGLIVIGGNGSLSGAHLLASRYGVKTVGIPATIDNDINAVDMAIGADTAVNVALDAVDKIRDTATSLERVFVIEVMGRECGYIAMQVALAGGCENVILPEMACDMKLICEEIAAGNARGKSSWIVVVAEGRARAEDVAAAITLNTGLETRIAVLGHIQRGGRPSARDRILASRLGHFAVQTIIEGKSDCCVTIRNGRKELVPLETAILPKPLDVEADFRLLQVLS